MSLARNGLLSLGYQPSPVTPRWSSRAVLLFHYHRGSRSMERRHHYPSGLMRLSHCRKGQAITAGAVFSLETRRGWREMEVKLIVQADTHANKSTLEAACMFTMQVSSMCKKYLPDKNSLSRKSNFSYFFHKISKSKSITTIMAIIISYMSYRSKTSKKLTSPNVISGIKFLHLQAIFSLYPFWPNPLSYHKI